MGKHVKTVESWDLCSAQVLGKEIPLHAKIQASYGGKVRFGNVERIGERADGSQVLTVDTQDGLRNLDADTFDAIDIIELV